MSELRVAPEGAHPLPEGGWVCFRDPATVIQRDRKALLARIDTAAGAGAGQLGQSMSSVDGVLALAITEWSLEQPVPAIAPELLDEMSIPLYDALAELVKPFRDALFPDMAKAEAEAKAKASASSPTGPSVA